MLFYVAERSACATDSVAVTIFGDFNELAVYLMMLLRCFVIKISICPHQRAHIVRPTNAFSRANMQY